MAIQSEATQNKIAILTAVAGITLSVLVAIGSYEFNRLSNLVDSFSTSIGALTAQTQINTNYRVTHGEVGDAKRYIKMIDSLGKAVHALQTDAAARKDAFTGTDAAEADSIYRALIAVIHRRLHIVEAALINKNLINQQDVASGMAGMGGMESILQVYPGVPMNPAYHTPWQVDLEEKKEDKN